MPPETPQRSPASSPRENPDVNRYIDRWITSLETQISLISVPRQDNAARYSGILRLMRTWDRDFSTGPGAAVGRVPQRNEFPDMLWKRLEGCLTKLEEAITKNIAASNKIVPTERMLLSMIQFVLTQYFRLNSREYLKWRPGSPRGLDELDAYDDPTIGAVVCVAVGALPLGSKTGGMIGSLAHVQEGMFGFADVLSSYAAAPSLRVLTNTQATKDSILAAIRQASHELQRANPPRRLVVTLSMHGTTGGKMIPYQATVQGVVQVEMSAQEIAQVIGSRQPATIIVDTCHGRGIGALMNSPNIEVISFADTPLRDDFPVGAELVSVYRQAMTQRRPGTNRRPLPPLTELIRQAFERHVRNNQGRDQSYNPKMTVQNPVR